MNAYKTVKKETRKTLIENDKILINYSTWDKTTQIGIYDKKYIQSLLLYF